PLIGELLWSLYNTYHLLWFRSVMLFRGWWDDDPEVAKVFDEKAIVTLVAEVMGPEEGSKLDGKPGDWLALRTRIEQKLVITASKVISGEASADLGLEQANRISAAIIEVQKPKNPPHAT